MYSRRRSMHEHVVEGYAQAGGGGCSVLVTHWSGDVPPGSHARVYQFVKRGLDKTRYVRALSRRVAAADVRRPDQSGVLGLDRIRVGRPQESGCSATTVVAPRLARDPEHVDIV